MSRLIKQSSTAQPLTFLMIDSTDHLSGKTGLTPTVKISKAGGTGASPSGSVTEVDATNNPGLYKVAGNATDTNTLGALWLHASASGADPADVEFQIVSFDPIATGSTRLAQAADAAAQNTIYVAAAGSDSNDGLSPSSPVLTIAHALSIVPNGGTIQLGAGTWREQVDLSAAAKAITIAGQPTPGATVIKLPDGQASGSSCIFNSGGEAGGVIRDITLDNNALGSGRGGINWIPNTSVYGRLLIVDRVRIHCSGLTTNGLGPDNAIYFNRNTTDAQFLMRDSFIITNGSALFFEDLDEVNICRCGFIATFGISYGGSDGRGVMQDCTIYITRDSAFASSDIWGVLLAGASLTMDNCTVECIDTSVTNFCYAVQTAGPGSFLLASCNINVSGTTGQIFSFNLGGGATRIDRATRYDGTKVTGATLQLKYADELTPATSKFSITGDAYSRLGAPVGASTSADIAAVQASATTLTTRLTAARAGYLDFMNVGGLIASQADVQGVTQAQRVRVLPAPQMERPDDGTPVAYRVWIYAYSATHTAEDLDSLPTVTAENNAGVDRSSHLGTVTKPAATTGQYYVDYTVSQSDAIEGLVFKVTATKDTIATVYAAPSVVVDTTAVDFTASDRTNLSGLATNYTSTRAAKLDNLDATVTSRMATFTYTAPLDATGVRGALGMAAANLDVQLGAIPTTAAPTAAQNAAAVLDVAGSDHDTAGTIGAAIQTGGAATISSDDISAIATASAAAIAGTIDPSIYAAATGSTLDLFRGDSYQAADGRGILITKTANETQWPSTLSTVDFYCEPTAATLADFPSAQSLGPVACTVVTATGSAQALRLELTGAQMLTLQAGLTRVGGYKFWLIANRGTNPATLRSGSMTVRPDPTA